MRLVKTLFLLGTAILLAGVLLHAAVLSADGGRPMPRPPAVQLGGFVDGGRPMPRPPASRSGLLVADGGRPMPRPPLSVLAAA